ncbi:amidohydrolase family protein [Falsirhodobacter sp. 20TX0035]|uniref:amidohydrolase family protein n=1 Tax=Falsirhodobacter sp. 20TX0035 TaxID=3022019 RepID=UPI0023315919|nr:amidohydrolase family protein [Falsirhodobacter sp. 20TX0035]MDB6454076.1 amidohydrolase family protein [Falsirhodobacter sp. 20TX0035]
MLDAHQHFWTVARGDYGWMSPDLVALYRDFGPEDLRPLLNAAGVTRTVLIQAAETEAETDFLLDLARTTDFVAGVVGWIDMFDDCFAARLDHYAAQPKWVGLRPMLQEHDPARIGHPQFRTSLAEVARRGIPFDILTFPHHLPAMIEALRAAPGLHAIVDHISKPDMTAPLEDAWVRDIRALAAVPGMHCKISGLVTEAGEEWSADRIRPFFDIVADAFGPERLVFGSDWPVCTLAATYPKVLQLARDLLAYRFGAEAMAAIMEANGARFYRLGRR